MKPVKKKIKNILLLLLTSSLVILLTGCFWDNGLEKGGIVTDKIAVKLAIEDLGIDDFNFLTGDTENNITRNFDLPTEGNHSTIITWESNSTNISILTEATEQNAVIIRPEYGNDNKSVKLQATVSRGDENRTKDFYVIIKGRLDTDKDITSFSILNERGFIDGNKIKVVLIKPVDLSSLKAAFITSGKSVSINSVVQESNVTDNNFSGPLTYTVKDENGSFKEYTVYVDTILMFNGNIKNLGNSILTDSENNIYIAGTFKGLIDFDLDPGPEISSSQDNTSAYITCINSNESLEWYNTIGTYSENSEGFQSGYRITHDNASNIIITGGFKNSLPVDFDPGDNIDEHNSMDDEDIFISKYSTNGSYLWTKTFGGNGNDHPNSLKTDNTGNIYIAGNFSHTIDFGNGTEITSKNNSTDIFIAKFDHDGNHTWTKTIGGNYADTASSLAIDNSSNTFVTGIFRGEVDFGNGTDIPSYPNSDSIFITKINSNGTHLWTKVIGGNSIESASSIALTDNGDIIVAGFFMGDVDFDPSNELDNRTSNTDGNGSDIFITKLSSDGDYLWTKTIAGNKTNNCNSMIIDRNGDILLTGFFTNTVDFNPNSGVDKHTSNGEDWDIFLTKLSADGDYSWTKTIGSNNYDSGTSIAVDTNNKIYVTGKYYYDVTGNDNYTSSTFIWSPLND